MLNNQKIDKIEKIYSEKVCLKFNSIKKNQAKLKYRIKSIITH